MTKPITVVKVESGAPEIFKVTFSGKVYLPWSASRSRIWWCGRSNGIHDELGAYLWGLKVIEEHYERVEREHA